MLVLSRKIGEEIVIDGIISVKVLGAANGRISLGIVAPRHVAVDRAEVHERRSQIELPDAPPSKRTGTN
jgi:carbon storage regulator